MPRTLKADDATEVALSSNGTVLPVDDETNFGPLSGKKKSVLAPEALAMDPRALAKKLAANAGRLPPTRTPTPRSRRLRPERRRSLEEDEPTLLGETTGFSGGPTEEDPPAPAPPEQVDPRELARRLAAEAKQKIAQEQAEATAPPAPAPPPAEDPAALARRLAAEAKARIAEQAEPKPAEEPPAEDPAALARRLAAEAKARLEQQASAPEPEPVPEPVAAPADEAPEEELAADAADVEEEAVHDEPAEPADGNASSPPKARSGLAARAPAPRAHKATSAKEALQAALKRSSQPAPERQAAPPRKQDPPTLEADSATVVAVAQPVASVPPRPAPQRSVPQPPAPQKPAPQKSAPVHAEKSVPPSPEKPAQPRPEPARSRPPTPAYLVALRELLPTAKIERERPVLKPAVFSALWEAHQARAVKDNQLELAASAGVLLARIADRSPGDIIGIQLSHKKQAWAAFVDRTDGAVLAIVPDPAVYLAGLQ